MANLQIALSGNIGVGKSGLCEALAQVLGARAEVENISENNHFEDFYAEPADWAFPSQLAFAAEATARHLRAQDGRPVVMDRTLYEGIGVFARVLSARGYLNAEQMNFFQWIERRARELPLQPSLLIHMAAPVEVLMERILIRGRPAESSIETSYLEALDAGYKDFLMNWNICPIIEINAAERDYRDPVEIMNLADRAQTLTDH